MSAAYVANRGSGTIDSTFSLTWTFTTTGAVSSGNKIILAIVLHSSANTIDSVSGGSLTWTQDAFGSNADGEVTYLFSADAPSGLSSGTTITVVEHTGGDVFERRRYEAMEWSGLATGAPSSTHKSGGSGTSTTPSSGASSAAAAIGDVAVGVIAWKNTSTSTDWTVTSGYTKENTLSANGRSMWLEYQILGSSGAVTSHPTTSLTSIQWAACVCFYAATVTGFSGTAGLSGAGHITASGFMSKFGAAALHGLGVITASAVVAVAGTAHLVGHGSIGAIARALRISVSGNDITAEASGAATVADLVDAINADTSASALVTADLPSGDGSDLVTDL